MSTDHQFLLISAFKTVSTTFSGRWSRGFAPGQSSSRPTSAWIEDSLQPMQGSSLWCRRKWPCRRSFADRPWKHPGQMCDVRVCVATLFLHSMARQSKANTSATVQAPHGIGSELPDNSAVGLLTSHLQVVAVVAVRYELHWRPNSSCTTVALRGRASRASDCVEEATENQKNGATARCWVSQPVHRAASYRGPAQGRQVDGRSENPPNHSSHNQAKQEFTWT